ncbi:MAG TPA: SMP-30/gluconolactonase/LRE family protein [Rhizomicrobium sp.]|nr:SMP-30/gluconolactonase/LRE family protein [Rhizomicrobium sp.]
MRPAARAAATAGTLVLIAALALAFRSLNAFGVFTDVVPGFAGSCTAIPTAPGPEDIAIDETSGFAFISAMDRRARAAGRPSPSDGLYAMALAGPAHPARLAGTPADFHPHGISLVRTPDGQLTLMAINHRAGGANSVDVFDVAVKDGAVRLSEIASIQSGQLVSPNAIAAVDRSRFYVTNDHTSATALGRMLDDLLLIPRANILYFDGEVFHVVARDLVFPSGAALSPDGGHLYVTEAYERRLTTYAREPFSGALTAAVDTLAIPSNPDNLRFDGAGNLWVGSHPKALAMAVWRSDPSRPAPSQIFKVTLADGIPKSAIAVYTNAGGEIGGSSVAAVSGRRMLIGSPFDTKILDCRMNH